MTPESTPSRHIPLQGAGNLRDLGGTAGLPGQLIYRSDDLSRLTRSDLAALQRLRLRLVIDLRTADEIHSRPDRLPAVPGLRSVQIPISPRRGDFAARSPAAFLRREARQFDFYRFILDYYHQIAFDHTAQIGEIFTLLSDRANLPALIHCTAGKDRTGVLAALIQLVAGVPHSTVMDDYLLSNTLSAARMRSMLQLLRLLSLYRIPAERLKPVLEVRAAYLEQVLDEIDTTYGGVEGYLLQAVGLAPACLLQMRQSLAPSE